jgi:hypothetical protein
MFVDFGTPFVTISKGHWKLPEMLGEWQGKVSPVIMFPQLSAKSCSAFSKSRVIFKSRLPEAPQNAR